MNELLNILLKEVKNIARQKISATKRLQEICDLLRSEIKTYDWVGFYVVNPEDKRELILGPFSGEPTEHVRIPFGKGICGQAAETKQTFIINDVAKESNYLSCNTQVRSEIVLPIFKDKEIMGELDLDSHTVAAFEKDDEDFLREVSKIVSKIL